MKAKKILDETTNRKVYNRTLKMYREQKGIIHCSFCQYHCGENRTTKWYGSSLNDDKIRYPNWKLVSKNRKQWMKKPLKISISYTNWTNIPYIDIEW